MKKYLVKEIFGPTLQGEGTHAGLPVLFLRFAGCNKWNGKAESKAASICNYCDTDFVGGTMMTKNEIAQALLDLSDNVRHVVISGGEPTLQLDKELANYLNMSFFLHLETNGSKDVSDYSDKLYHITCSPKQSFEDTKLKRCDDLKLLYPYISEEITLHQFVDAMPHINAWLQPVEREGNYTDNFKQLESELCDYATSGVKLSLQQHKILGVQ